MENKMILNGCFQTQYRLVSWKPVIYLFSRTKEGQKEISTVENFRPYVYISEETLSKKGVCDKIVFVEVKSYCSIFGDKVKKCYVQKPSDIYYVRTVYDNKDVYEADILYPISFLIDNVEKIEPTKYKLLVYDIETDCEHGFPKEDNPVEPIICASLHDNYSNNLLTYVWRKDLVKEVKDNVYYFNNEKDMLNAFINKWREVDADIVSSWSHFDINYLVARMRKLDMDINLLSTMNKIHPRDAVIVKPKGEIEILGTVLYDMMKGFKRLRFGMMDFYNLNAVAEAELGEKKDKMVNTGSLWRNDIQNLVVYNRKDVRLVVDIEKKARIISMTDETRRYACLPSLNDCFYSSRVHDVSILRKYHNKVVFPTKPPFKEREKDESEIKGAFVKSVPGVYSNVVLMDYKSLYPNIIRTFNLSPEQIKEDGVEINGVKISQKEVGIIPSIIDDLLNLKKELNKKIEGTGQSIKDAKFSVKVTINSLWGSVGLSSFRLYNKDIANNITFLGRWLIGEATRIVEKDFGYNIVFADTDSCGIKIPDNLNPIEEGKKIQSYINKKIKQVIMDTYSIKESSIEMEFEAVFKTLMLVAKKNYAGWIVWEDGEVTDKIKKAGISSRRSDVAPIGKQVQNDLLEIILKEKDKQKAISYVKNLINNIIQGKISVEDIAIPTKFNKAIEDYPTQNLPKIRGTKWANKNLGTNFRDGIKVKLIYVKHPETDCVCFEEPEQIKDLKIDWEAMIDKSVLSKVKQLFEPIGWNKECDELENYAKTKVGGQRIL